MKRLVRQEIRPKVKTQTTKTTTTKTSEKSTSGNFTSVDLVDILSQLDELKNHNIAAKFDEGKLVLAIGDTRYEVSSVRDPNRYPNRRVVKLET
jgi:hypothetical protein